MGWQPHHERDPIQNAVLILLCCLGVVLAIALFGFLAQLPLEAVR
jgi:hypothetical protein